jgi:outer membrane receptor protein involved in Fe transport
MPRRWLAALILTSAAAMAQETGAIPDTVVSATRPDTASQNISPALGASATTLDRQMIEGLPGGEDAPIRALLLQTPGVAQDSFGELHIRGEHRGLQYQLNGITLPEGVAGGFGAFLDARAIETLSILTGALPAQFGYRTGGVIDLTLRSPSQGEGGSASVYGGSRGTIQSGFDHAIALEGWELFASGSVLRSDQGTEGPTSARTPLHNRTEQGRGLFYLSRALDERTRLSFISGAAINNFQIANIPGRVPSYTAFGRSEFDSARLNGRQGERNIFNVLALQHSQDGYDAQIALFQRHSQTQYRPDYTGEVLFNGVASDVRRRSNAYGLQADSAWRVVPAHTIRMGVSVIADATLAQNRSILLPLDDSGAAQDDPFGITDRRSRTGWTWGAYIQDEWRIAEALTMNAGLRADYIDAYVKAGQVSPRVNLVWTPRPGTRIALGYARYFTPPAQDLITPGALNLFANSSAAPLNTTNSRVRPERSHYLNLAVQQRATENLTFGFGAYYKDARDLLDLGQFGSAVVYTPFNYSHGQVYGVEFTGQWRSRSFDAYANLALSRAAAREITSGQFNFDPEELAYIARRQVRLDHDQTVTASAGLIYRPWQGARATATLLVGSGLRRGFANSEKAAAYGTGNIGFAQDISAPDGGVWTLRADIINVTDTVTQLRDGSGIGVGAPQFLARRGFYMGLSRRL